MFAAPQLTPFVSIGLFVNYVATLGSGVLVGAWVAPSTGVDVTVGTAVGVGTPGTGVVVRAGVGVVVGGTDMGVEVGVAVATTLMVALALLLQKCIAHIETDAASAHEPCMRGEDNVNGGGGQESPRKRSVKVGFD